MPETPLTLIPGHILLVLTVVLISGCATPMPSTTTSPAQPATLEPTANRIVAALPIPPTGQGGPVYLPLVQNVYSASSDWAQLAGNAQHSGYVPGDLPQPWHIKWIWNGPPGGGDAGPGSDHLVLPAGVQPVTGAGRLYLGHSDGVARALSETDGHLIWTSPLGGEILNTGAFDPVTQSVYFGSTNGSIYRLDAFNGHIQSSFSTGGRVEMAPLLAGDTVYIGSTNGSFYALDKTSLAPRWPAPYQAGAALLGSPAYSASHSGLIIIEAEDKSIHALQAVDGSRRWRVTVNAYRYDTDNKDYANYPSYKLFVDNRVFFNSYPVVSDANGVVIIRSYLARMAYLMAVAPSTIPEIRSYLVNNPQFQSFFVLNLDTGQPGYVPPVMFGAIGDGDIEAVPAQVVLKPLPDGTEVAYLYWRNYQACYRNVYDGREDTTLGEMDLKTGNIRFVQSYKNQGVIRLPTDEQAPLMMVGDTLLQAHWMTLGSLQITDRSLVYGSSYANPIKTKEGVPVLNTLTAGSCPKRANHYCPDDMYTPGDTYLIKPGFYVYYSNQRVYDQFTGSNPRDVVATRSAIVHNQTIYWRTVDGAIVAVGP